MFSPAAHAAPEDECEAGRHQYAEILRVPATAMEDGEVTYLCGVCGRQYTEILYATDHLWGEWVVDTRPTCTRPGEKHRTCGRGQSHDEYAEMPALGHEYKPSVTTQPGCETQGVTTFACVRCGDKYTRPIPAVGHDYEEAAAEEPSCLEPGVRRFVCAHDPAHAYEEEIPPIGSHSFGEWAVETPAGEGAEGLEARTCARDGFRETRVLAALPVPVSEPGKISVADIILVGANVGFLAIFALLFIPYLVCLRYIKKRRDAVNRRDALRKKVEERYDFK
ncbi:MAG: hypothetical protein FWC27_10275 [Firmicutes bacterium]|nr:hypothetical protein [Bacillota bacterium]